MGLERSLEEKSEKNDIFYMKRALELAKLGEGMVNPNPLVGCVIVKNGEIIGEGYHEVFGGLHAERNALKNCQNRGNSSKNAVMYVTLEPCCHTGKTPPCTEAILEYGIQKVIVGCLDSHEKVAGKGVDILRFHGIQVEVGILEEECVEINKVFFHFIEKRTPFVVMKYGMTMDGKIATVTGESQWITGEKSRERVHFSRNKYMGIMVGVGTVLIDDPLLTCRVGNGRNPVRIICDTHLRTPITSRIVETAKDVPTVIATAVEDKERIVPYLEKKCEVFTVSSDKSGINLTELMEKLGEYPIDGILLEGGSTLNFSALESGIVQKVECYMAPKLFGGVDSKTPVGGRGFEKISQCVRVKNTRISVCGEDFLLESEVESNVYGDC